MAKYRLGISSSHNSSVALLDATGNLRFALQEERLSRIKNHWSLPEKSLQMAVDLAGGWSEISRICFGGIIHPATRSPISREMIKEALLQSVSSHSSLRQLASIGLRKLEILRNREKYITKLKSAYSDRHLQLLHEAFPASHNIPVDFINHHDAHFATACFGGPSVSGEDLLVFTYDGQGDGICGTVKVLRANGQIETLSQIEDEHSISTLYGLVTFYLGFVIFEHEYKLMGMAPYANAERSRAITNQLRDLYYFNNGAWRLKKRLRYTDLDESRFFNELQRIFKFKRFDEICAGVQFLVEDLTTYWISYWINQTGIRKIRCSGGLFLNVKANMNIMNLDCVDEIFVYPSCGDETNSIGAAYYSFYRETRKNPAPLRDLGLGRSYTNADAENAIKAFTSKHKLGWRVEQIEDIEDKVAELLSQNKVVARVEGREEFGARALGHRSILANPSTWHVVTEINRMIKKRDFWMPFACSILEEYADKYIQNPKKVCADYMIMCFPCTTNAGEITSGTHPQDNTVRAQIVKKDVTPSYHKLISAFQRRTGIGAVLNTSFNLHGFPLVGSPEDALEVFHNSGLQYLAIENFMLSKQEL